MYVQNKQEAAFSLFRYFCNMKKTGPTFYLYTSCLFSMLLNYDIIDIEKPDGICLLTFVLNEF